MLADLHAAPAVEPGWDDGLTLQECHRWAPHPLTTEHLDHLVVTDHGLLNTTSWRTGTYAQLLAGSRVLELAGHPVQVCDPREVLARLDGKSRPKDIERTGTYHDLASKLDPSVTPD